MLKAGIVAMAALALTLESAYAQALLGSSGYAGLLECKAYAMEGSRASKAAPVVEGALRNAYPEAMIECAIQEGGKSMTVTAPRKAMPLADALIKALAEPEQSKEPTPPSEPEYGFAKPKFIAASSLAKMLSSSQEAARPGSQVLLDLRAGSVYWKGPGSFMEEAVRIVEAEDKPQTQVRIVFKAYRMDAKGIKNLERAVLASAKGAPFSKTLMEAIGSRLGVDSAGSAECAVAQGLTSSSAMLDAGASVKFKITAAYPIVDAKKDGGLSIYTDFVFDYGSGIRNTRWTLKSGGELPLAAFPIKVNGKRTASFLDMAELEPIMKKQDKAALASEIIVVTGEALAAEE